MAVSASSDQFKLSGEYHEENDILFDIDALNKYYKYFIKVIRGIEEQLTRKPRFTPRIFIGHYYDITILMFPRDKMTEKHCKFVCSAIYPTMLQSLVDYLNDNSWEEIIEKLSFNNSQENLSSEEISDHDIKMPAILALSSFPEQRELKYFPLGDHRYIQFKEGFPFLCSYVGDNSMVATKANSAFIYDDARKTLHINNWGINMTAASGFIIWSLDKAETFHSFVEWMIRETIVT